MVAHMRRIIDALAATCLGIAREVRLFVLVVGNPFQPTKEPRPWIPISTAGVGKPEPRDDLSEQVSHHGALAQDLVASIRENRQPICSLDEGALTVEMVCAVFECDSIGGEPSSVIEPAEADDACAGCRGVALENELGLSACSCGVDLVERVVVEIAEDVVAGARSEEDAGIGVGDAEIMCVDI